MAEPASSSPHNTISPTTRVPLSTTSSAPEPETLQGFVPDVGLREGMEVVQLIFMDGTEIEMSYPPELDIAGMGLESRIAVRLLEGEHARCGALIEADQLGTTEAGASAPLATFPTPGGSLTRLIESSGPAAQLLIFDIGEWTASIPFSEGDACPPEHLSPIWSSYIELASTPNGFITVTPVAPVALDSHQGTDRGQPTLTFGLTGTFLTISLRPCHPGIDILDAVPAGAVACMDNGEIQIHVQGEESFVDAVLAEVEIIVLANE